MSNIKTTKSRKWLITINNPKNKFEEIKEIIIKKWGNIKYFCYCKELGLKEKTEHYHIFLWFDNPIMGSSVLKTFEGCHLDLCNGSAQDNRDYVYKEGKYKDSDKEDTKIEGMQFESGELPEENIGKGKRNDLVELREMILNGKSNAEIYNSNANFMKYADNIDRVRNDLLSDKYKDEWRNLEVCYIHGQTGAGKTRTVMEQWGYRNVCRVTDYMHPFERYNNHDVIVFEEFRSDLKIQDMLNYLDGYPLTLPSRYSNKQACYHYVYIISNIALDEQFENVQKKYPETWQAFLRRIKTVKVYSQGDIYEYKQIKENGKFDYITDDGIKYFNPLKNPEKPKTKKAKEPDLIDAANNEDYFT